MFKNYFKTTIRNFWKNRSYSFLNIFGLAVGICCAGLIFLWVEDEMSYDHNNTKFDQVFQVMGNQAYEGKTYTFAATPGLLGPALKKDFPEIRTSSRLTFDQYTLFSLGDKSTYETGYYADSSFFDIFTVPFLQGSKEKAFELLHSVVISEKMAKKFFGDAKEVIGKTLRMDNQELFTVSGIIKDLPENSTLQFDWIAPFKVYYNKNTWLTTWGNNGIQTFVELNKEANPDILNKKLDGYIARKDTNSVANPFLFSMKDWRLRGKFEEGKQAGGRIQYVHLFSIIAWIILLIACINFMNLATARSEKRAREVGVRKVLGALKRILIGQFIGEALFMSFISVALAIGIIYLIIPPFNSLVGKHLELGLDDPWHIAALSILGIICGLVAGSYPAFYLSSFNPAMVLKGLKIKGHAPVLIRKGLVVLQFTISVVLIVSTIIIYQQIQHIKGREIGYDKNNLIQTGLHGSMDKNFAAIKQQLTETGYVKNVALSSLNMLYMGSSTTDFRWEGKDPAKKVLITQDYISPEYLSTTGVKIKQGHDFYPSGNNQSVIINEALANMIGKNPVGKMLFRDTSSTGAIHYTIAGVTKDFVYGDMYGKSDPLVFISDTGNYGYMYIRVKPEAHNDKALAGIESIIKRNNPGYPFDYIFVDAEFDRQFRSETLVGTLSRVFAGLAILISCLGLFGLAAYTAERRTREIGIRKVLGASVSGITALLSKDFLQLVGISALIALPLAWWSMHSWLQGFAYRVEISWWVFLVAGMTALLIALLTVSFQAIRSALANPVKSLRAE
jgi:putative ABC transport system permease protein